MNSTNSQTPCALGPPLVLAFERGAREPLSRVIPQASVELTMRQEQLTAVPSTISVFSCLTSLDLHYNQLASLPKSIGKLTNLRELSSRPDSPGKTVMCLVLYKGRKSRVDIELSPASAHVEVFDAELEDFLDLAKVSDLGTTGKARVRITDRLAAPLDGHHGSGKPVTASAPAARPEEPRGAPQVLSRHMGEAVEAKLGLREYLRFPAGYRPAGTCAEELVRGKVLRDDVAERLVAACTEFTNDRLEYSDAPEVRSLTRDEAFAVVAYTFDLLADGEGAKENLYVRLNSDLRARDKGRMAAWRGYLWHLLSGLNKLPPVATRLYRGVPGRSAIAGEYKQGRRIRWSAFTSATDSEQVARTFAGPEGVVFRILGTSARDVRGLSYVEGELEHLLSPNVTFRVSAPLHDEGGAFFIDLAEESPDDVYVF
eukprot:m51a1_g9902 putative uracil-dna glycosylase (428) ;mRNA; f:77696-80021